MADLGFLSDSRYVIHDRDGEYGRSGLLPGFLILTVGTLGLAIGANAGIWSVVDTVLLDTLPDADADRLVYVAGSAPGSDFPPEFPVAAEFYVG